MVKRKGTAACSLGHNAALMVPGDLGAQRPLLAVPAPGMFAESYWEGAAHLMASCLEHGSRFKCVVGLLMATVPSKAHSGSSAIV